VTEGLDGTLDFATFLYVLLDGPEADECGDVFDALAEVAEGRTTVHAILIGENVAKNLLGVN
jgi:hypothetical protein